MDEKNNLNRPQGRVGGGGQDESGSFVRRRPEEYSDLTIPQNSAKRAQDHTAPQGEAERRPSNTAAPHAASQSRTTNPDQTAVSDVDRMHMKQNSDVLDGATRISTLATKMPSDGNKGFTGGEKGKKKKKRSRMSESGNSVISVIKCVAYITGVFSVSILLSAVLILAANDIYAFVKSSDEVEIDIPEGAGIDDVAEILSDNRIVNYEFLFKTYAKVKKKDEGFCAGTYTVSPAMNYDALLAEFKEKTQTGIQWVTIPEGYTVDEIIDLLVDKHQIGDRERYIDVINNYDFNYWFIDELGDDWAADGRLYRLEGYLFPDSYQFYSNSSEEVVIDKMLTRFNQVFTKNYRNRAQTMGYSVDEILTLASIIEKEAGRQDEFNKVSSVFHNRLNSPEFPCLESDATVMYIIHHETGSRPELTSEDLEYDTPYNTYKNEGLPPGPIANPSNSAILAALNPSHTDYYFFVSFQNETFFSRTKSEHDAVIQEINERKQQAAAENNRNSGDSGAGGGDDEN